MRRAAKIKSADAQKSETRSLADSPLLKPKEVAEILGLSVSTVCGMLRRGELPGIVVREGRGPKRTRRIYRVRRSELEAFIEGNSTQRSGGVK